MQRTESRVASGERRVGGAQPEVDGYKTNNALQRSASGHRRAPMEHKNSMTRWLSTPASSYMTRWGHISHHDVNPTPSPHPR